MRKKIRVVTRKKIITKVVRVPKYKDKLILFKDRSESDKQKLAENLKNFCTELETKFDLKTFLCGGTFLGAYRDGDFIPHDDDLDINYYLEESNQIYAQKKSIEIFQYFKSIDRVGDYYNHCHYHIFLEKKTYFTDIWPCWSENNIFYSGGNRNKIYYGLPIDNILPLRSFIFRNQEFSIPNKPNNFAKWMWGDSWNTPKKLKHGYIPKNVKLCPWKYI